MKTERSILEKCLYSFALIWLIVILVFINQASLTKVGDEYRQIGSQGTIERHLIKEMVFTTEINENNEPIYNASIFPTNTEHIFCCFYLVNTTHNEVKLKWYYVIPEYSEPLLYIHELYYIDAGWQAIPLSLDDLPENLNRRWPKWGCYAVLTIGDEIAGVGSFCCN